MKGVGVGGGLVEYISKKRNVKNAITELLGISLLAITSRTVFPHLLTRTIPDLISIIGCNCVAMAEVIMGNNATAQTTDVAFKSQSQTVYCGVLFTNVL